MGKCRISVWGNLQPFSSEEMEIWQKFRSGWGMQDFCLGNLHPLLPRSGKNSGQAGKCRIFVWEIFSLFSLEEMEIWPGWDMQDFCVRKSPACAPLGSGQAGTCRICCSILHCSRGALLPPTLSANSRNNTLRWFLGVFCPLPAVGEDPPA